MNAEACCSARRLVALAVTARARAVRSRPPTRSQGDARAPALPPRARPRGSRTSRSSSPRSRRCCGSCPRTRSTDLGPARRRVGRGRRDLHRAHARRRARSGAGRSGARGGSGTRASPPPRSSSSSTSATSRCAAPARPPTERGKRCAIAALIAFADVPIVHFSVTWWQTLHQDGTVFNPKLDVQIDGSMAFTLVLAVVAFTLLYAYLVLRAAAARRARRRPRGARARARDRRARAAPSRWCRPDGRTTGATSPPGYAHHRGHARRVRRCWLRHARCAGAADEP